ncbi:hypothetical protein [Achromobacter anxifer]|uniref:hypothetical protein n=1 Tax=Achromobacter anxifer TaxID=1287737 RepID=UPI00159061A9|nr:hypothetical protein [Achromobacter anxifer]
MNEDTVATVKGVTASIRTLEKLGLVKRAGGSWITADRYSTPLVPAAIPQSTFKPDPYSLIGLQLRGFRVLPGEMAEDHRVEIAGAFIRITEARKNGLI